MAFRFCYTSPDGTTVCFDIPVLVFPPDPPSGPRPHPWLPVHVIDRRLTPELMQDLALLVTIDSLAESLSPSLRMPLQDQLRDVVQQLQLPENVKVEMVAFQQRGGS